MMFLNLNLEKANLVKAGLYKTLDNAVQGSKESDAVCELIHDLNKLIRQELKFQEMVRKRDLSFSEMLGEVLENENQN